MRISMRPHDTGTQIGLVDTGNVIQIHTHVVPTLEIQAGVTMIWPKDTAYNLSFRPLDSDYVYATVLPARETVGPTRADDTIEHHLRAALAVARAAIKTDPDHACGPNFRADERVRDLLEEMIHDGR